MSDRDCPHGHKLGKCGSCELIAALAEKDAQLVRLDAAGQDYIAQLLKRITALEKDKRDAWELLNDVCSDHADKNSHFYNNCETPDTECVWCFDAKKLKPVEVGDD